MLAHKRAVVVELDVRHGIRCSAFFAAMSYIMRDRKEREKLHELFTEHHETKARQQAIAKAGDALKTGEGWYEERGPADATMAEPSMAKEAALRRRYGLLWDDL